MVEDLLLRGLAELSGHKIVADAERRLFTGHLLLEFPYPGRDPFVAEKRLNTVGEVACHRDLDLRSRIEPPGACGGGELHRGLEP